MKRLLTPNLGPTSSSDILYKLTQNSLITSGPISKVVIRKFNSVSTHVECLSHAAPPPAFNTQMLEEAGKGQRREHWEATAPIRTFMALFAFLVFVSMVTHHFCQMTQCLNDTGFLLKINSSTILGQLISDYN